MKLQKKEVNLKGPFHKKYSMKLERLEITSGTYYTLYKNNNPILKLDERNLMKLKIFINDNFK